MTLPAGIDLRPSGKFRARLTWKGTAHSEEFGTQAEAVNWRTRTRRQLSLGTHPSQIGTDPETGEESAPYFRDYAETWLAGHEVKASTRAGYRALIDSVLVPEFGDRRIDAITPAMVKKWHAGYALDRPTRRAHAYGLLRTILGTAYADDLISANPCRIKGGGTVKRAGRTELPSAAQVAALADAMPSDKYRAMVLMSAWCGLRFGEATELRRKDIVIKDGVPVCIRVRRAVARVLGEFIVGTPKSEAGVRDVAVPPHIRQAVADHMATLPKSPEALLFPGTRNGAHMAPSSLYKPFYRVRAEVGLPALRWHDLRHFAGTTVAQTGATLKEIQDHLGHSTVAAAMKYQHTAQGRGAQIAEAMSALA